VPGLTLSVGPILPVEDQPARPVVADDLDDVEFTPIDAAPNVLQTPEPPQLVVATRGPLNDRYICFLAEATGIEDPVFTWTGVQQSFDDGDRSFADLVFPPVVVLPQRVTVTVESGSNPGGGLTESIDIVSVTPSPHLTARGIADQPVVFTFRGRTVSENDSLQFDPDDVVVTMQDPPGQAMMSVLLRPFNHEAPDNDAQGVQPGPRTIVFTLGGEEVSVENAMTVYEPGAAVRSLITILDRPAPTDARPRLPDAGVGKGNRTQAQDDRITAVINATTRAEVVAAWNPWTSSDATLVVPPVPYGAVQFAIVADAAARLEQNFSKPTIPSGLLQPPPVPVSMWRDLLDFIVSEESGPAAQGSILAVAGVASENSYGIVQFNDSRAGGNNFTSGTNGPLVPILRPGIAGDGIIADWKASIIAANDFAALRTLLNLLLTGDWRAYLIYSLRNFIRSSQAYYARVIMAPGGTTGYSATDDFRVDLVPPARANGSGSQRDLFELLPVAHRLPSDAFGGLFQAVNYEGGLLTRTTPNEWHTVGSDPVSGKPYMTQAGTDRAANAQSFYDSNAPGGGYQ
jgi:hypothetical protein